MFLKIVKKATGAKCTLVFDYMFTDWKKNRKENITKQKKRGSFNKEYVFFVFVLTFYSIIQLQHSITFIFLEVL